VGMLPSEPLEETASAFMNQIAVLPLILPLEQPSSVTYRIRKPSLSNPAKPSASAKSP
jgi:hypothetical protein